MSFQKAHSISNELGEVVITSATTATAGWQGTKIGLEHAAVGGKSFRVLEIGFTTVVQGSGAAETGAFSVGIGTTGWPTEDIDAFILNADVPASSAVDVGESISTSRGGANALSFVAAGTGNVDADGFPRLGRGEVIFVDVAAGANITGGSAIVFYARLAPEIVRDTDT